MRLAIGLKPRTGRATMVIVGGEPRAPVFIESREVALLPPGAFAPYHVAAELPQSERQASVDRDVAAARSMAEAAIRDALRRCKAAGHEVVGCGVLVGNPLPQWSTDEIIAVHVRMHMAEGQMFRDVLVEAARSCKLGPVRLPDKSALESSAKALKMKTAQLGGVLDTLGKAAGPPWRKEQREAAAAALAALAGATGSPSRTPRAPR
jgi:hypothetical protein